MPATPNPVIQALNRWTGAQGKDLLDYATFTVLLLTFLALALYTVETSKLRRKTSKLLKEARRQNERSVMPMLALSVDLTGTQPKLMLRNVGFGAAFNVSLFQYQWADKELSIIDVGDMILAGESQTLRIIVKQQRGADDTHFLPGDISGLYQLLSTSEVPNPLSIKVRCLTIDRIPYTFLFDFALRGGHLTVTFNRLSKGDRGRKAEPNRTKKC